MIISSRILPLLLVLGLFAPDGAAACGDVLRDAAVDVSSLPRVEVWYGSAVRQRAVVPGCLDWPVDELKAAVEANGRFVEPGGWDAVISRIASISAQKEIRYWSQSRGRWRDLLTNAAALTAHDSAAERADFLPEELQGGRTLYFKQRLNGAEYDAVLGMDILERTPERLVIDIENEDGIPVFAFFHVQPSQTRLAIMIEAETDNSFRYRSLMGVDLELGPFLRSVAGTSLVHRSVAIFRFVAGIQTDSEPRADGR